MTSSSHLAPAPQRLELAEAAAVHSCYRASPAGGPDDPGAHVARIAGATAAALTVVDVGFFNRVIGLGSARTASADDVADIDRFYRNLGRAVWAVQVPDEVLAAELADALTAASYRRSRRWVKLWHSLEAIPDAPTALRVERVGPEHAADLEAIELAAMGIPPAMSALVRGVVGAEGWTTYLGFDGDTPVAAGAMHVDGDTAWLGFGATLEGARGRGGQSAIFAARLRDARDLGCTLAVTETGEETEEEPVNPSYRNMLRLGFTLAYARPNWVHLEDEPPPAGS
jgi:GNAT superfamily N-acetyltransferase